MDIKMKEPVLVIMAAGMGSRYGGLKQIDPVDGIGNKIIDFSIYDAREAGFQKVIFIIKRENYEEFRQCVGDKLKNHIDVEYVFQEISRIPEECAIPEGRVKPWGTAHAVLCCKEVIKGPFAVINADDYYGKESFRILYHSLTKQKDTDKYQYSMVGYRLKNTLTDHGCVSRGVCSTDSSNYLLSIEERTHIEKRGGRPAYTEDGISFTELPEETVVSMNMWGFTKSILKELESAFLEFMKNEVKRNPLKAECYLPSVVDILIKAQRARVNVLPTDEKWYGVTYKEDKPQVMKAIRGLKNKGYYPEKLWE